MQQDIAAIYQGVMDFITHAIHAAGAEPVVDMPVLNEKIEHLTNAINALPIEKRIQYRGELGVLFDALKELEETLMARKVAIQGEMESQPMHRAANTAYSKTNTMGKVEE